MNSTSALAGSAVLVTGGCGFIGSHLVRALVARSAGRVVVIDSLRYGDRDNLAGLAGKVEIVPFTLGTDDPAALDLKLGGIDFVFHLAAEKHNQSRGHPLETMKANVDGTYHLLDAATRHGVKKVVFTSSLYAYGRMSGAPFVETEVPGPWTVYGISKLCGEHLVTHFGRERGLPGLSLRYLFVYGPKQYAGMGYKSVIVRNFERILCGESPTICGDGSQVLDYVYVDDAVEATLRAMESSVTGETLNVGSGVGVTIEHLVKTMLRVSGKELETTRLPADWTAGSSRVADVSRIRAALAWTPAVSLDEGLARTFRWLEDRGTA